MKRFDQTNKGKKVKEKQGGDQLSKSHTQVHTPGGGSLSPSKPEGNDEDDDEETKKVEEARKSLKNRFKRN